MPQVGQKWCSMTCLLNLYVAWADSGVRSTSLSRGTNHSNDARRPHIEQLQASPLSISPSTSKATWPHWQLPWYFIASCSLGGWDDVDGSVRRKVLRGMAGGKDRFN